MNNVYLLSSFCLAKSQSIYYMDTLMTCTIVLSFSHNNYSLVKVEKCMAFFSVDGQSNFAIALEFLIFV